MRVSGYDLNSVQPAEHSNSEVCELLGFQVPWLRLWLQEEPEVLKISAAFFIALI